MDLVMTLFLDSGSMASECIKRMTFWVDRLHGKRSVRRKNNQLITPAPDPFTLTSCFHHLWRESIDHLGDSSAHRLDNTNNDFEKGGGPVRRRVSPPTFASKYCNIWRLAFPKANIESSAPAHHKPPDLGDSLNLQSSSAVNSCIILVFLATFLSDASVTRCAQ
jgi:hypothetical protein